MRLGGQLISLSPLFPQKNKIMKIVQYSFYEDNNPSTTGKGTQTTVLRGMCIKRYVTTMTYTSQKLKKP